MVRLFKNQSIPRCRARMTHPLEKTATNVHVETIREKFAELAQTLWHVVNLFGVIDGSRKKIDEPSQAVLVHWIDVCQIRYGEVNINNNNIAIKTISNYQYNYQ